MHQFPRLCCPRCNDPKQSGGPLTVPGQHLRGDVVWRAHQGLGKAALVLLLAPPLQGLSPATAAAAPVGATRAVALLGPVLVRLHGVLTHMLPCTCTRTSPSLQGSPLLAQLVKAEMLPIYKPRKVYFHAGNIFPLPRDCYKK